ncbi:hypothetical protein KCP70_13835 [Salmonella enterica subsp. enterica]|nr:hypothetical protein KCP70_13835 [Salmonella enterica subsp. enterica]
MKKSISTVRCEDPRGYRVAVSTAFVADGHHYRGGRDIAHAKLKGGVLLDAARRRSILKRYLPRARIYAVGKSPGGLSIWLISVGPTATTRPDNGLLCRSTAIPRRQYESQARRRTRRRKAGHADACT